MNALSSNLGWMVGILMGCLACSSEGGSGNDVGGDGVVSPSAGGAAAAGATMGGAVVGGAVTGGAPAGGAATGGAATGGAATGGAATGGAATGGAKTCDEETDVGIAAAITTVPANLPSVEGHPALKTYYAVTQYLYLPKLQIHIFGTKDVSNWTMVGAYRMSCGVVGSLADKASRDAFINHHVFAITGDDPDVPGASIAGHKNTGNAVFTVFNQDMVCATAVDTIRPNDKAVWRAWDTPVHEYGHTIEEGLDLQDTTLSVFKAEPGFEATVQQEYFAWTNQEWFDAEITRPAANFRASLAPFKRAYFASVYTESKEWRPSCVGRP